MKLKIATDCSGIETPLMALKKMKIKIDHIFSSEIDKNCIKFIEKNFKPKKIYKDLKTRDNNKYKKENIDLYIAGFPCQPFSLIGDKKGFKHERGNLFFNILDFLKKGEPKIFVLENVKNLKHIQNGEAFKKIITSLNKLKKYKVYHKILNSKDYGLPQNRERIFFIGIRKDIEKKKFEFPEAIKIKRSLKSMIKKGLSKSKLEGSYKKNKERIIKEVIKGKNQKMDDKNIRIYFLQFSNFNIPPGTPNICPCLTANGCHKLYIMNHERFLTPNEAKQIQGIPVKYNLGDTDRIEFKAIGNSMSVNLLIELFKQIFESSKIKITT